MALKIKACKNENLEAAAAYLEVLIVRRELAANFVYFNPYYDSLGSLPAWPTKTLAEHEKDVRDPVYTKSQLIACRTHDEYWNAAMKEMIVTGFMHNYMFDLSTDNRQSTLLVITRKPSWIFRFIYNLSNHMSQIRFNDGLH